MRLSQLLSLILAKTPLSVEVSDSEDVQLETPEALLSIDLHRKIGDIVADACRRAGLSERGACVFGEFVAGLCTGKETPHSRKEDLINLVGEFGVATFENQTKVLWLSLLPTWDDLDKHIEAIQRGVAAAFEVAKKLQ
jgi:hypothetical protein